MTQSTINVINYETFLDKVVQDLIEDQGYSPSRALTIAPDLVELLLTRMWSNYYCTLNEES